MSTSDSELLRYYVDGRSEAAFKELVERHVDLVYSAALRQLDGDEHRAQDITQTVFVDLARKARSLLGRRSLAGWLYTSARFAAISAIRSEQRRRVREEEAAKMQENEPGPESEFSWNRLRPVLEEAMHQLDEQDREALLLRYFEKRELKAIGLVFGISDDAARKRLDRALDRLRSVLDQRGIHSTNGALGALLTAAGLVAAPKGLAASIAAAVLGASINANVLTSTLMILKSKLGIATALVVAGLATALVTQNKANQQLKKQNDQLRAEAAQMDNLREENARLAKLQAASPEAEPFRNEHNELLRLRGQVASLRAQAAFSRGTPQAKEGPQTTDSVAQEESDQLRIDTINTMKKISGSRLASMPQITRSNSLCRSRI